MKILPVKGEINKVLKYLDSKQAKSVFKKPVDLHQTAVPVFNCLYINFMKDFAKETDTIMYLAENKNMKQEHINAAAKKVLAKYSHLQKVKSKIPKNSVVNDEISSSSEDDNEEEYNDSRI